MSDNNADNSKAFQVTPRHYSVIVIGAGQAGLAMSYCLGQLDIEHLVLEKSHCIGHAWRDQRWDSFCLVTPNWQCQLPGFDYAGGDPDGFMIKDEIIAYLQAYAAYFKPPIQFDSPVIALTRENENSIFHLQTPHNHYTADQVIIACGSYHQPRILSTAAGMPSHIAHLHSSQYRNAQQLAEGEVMVVGTGQSGCQIAEDLHLEGRKVHLCVGSAPRVNRRYRGQDVVKWLDQMGYYQTTIDKHPDGKQAAHAANHYVTGRDGGRDLNLRIFAQQGMELYGRLKSAAGGVIGFHDDLKQNLDNADQVAQRIVESIEGYIQQHKIEAPADDNIYSDYLPPTSPTLDLNSTKINTVVWATGFTMDFSWIDLAVTDEMGFPLQKRGVSVIPGLYFLGLNWMHTWGSGRFYHVGRDAEYLSQQIITTSKPSRSAQSVG